MIRDVWVFRLVSRSGQDMGTLDGVLPGSASLSGNVNSAIRWAGSLSLYDPDRFDWGKTRIKPVRVVDGVEQPYGVYIVRVSDWETTTTGMVGKLDLYDRTLSPSEDAVTSSFTVKAGTVVTTAVRQILESTGETGVSITDTTDTIRSDMVWEAGTSKLTIINDLADAAGYFALWADHSGQFRFEPYRAPQARPVVHDFAPGQDAVHLPDWSMSKDATVYNQIVCVSQETAGAAALVATVRNENPDSPWSFQAQGRWVTRVETGVEAASQAVLDAHAQRLLAVEGTAGGVVERRMLPSPFDLNSVVTAQDRREVVEQVKVECAPARLMQVTSRQVV